MANKKFLIIHGHFYQPPRESPWLGAIEYQPSAAPYPNWNARISRECYAPNGQARLLGKDGTIARIINNYEYLSFNFGPTLLKWLQDYDPFTYKLIIEADKKVAAEKKGHGPALAQVYNHIIMPLANRRDRITQVRWGIKDFISRFGRQPEGMWLAETAVDLETIKILAEEGIKFTILSQTQAQAILPLGDKTGLWQDAAGGKIDPREPYRIFWGNKPNDYLDVFFYDGPVSRAIAFEKLLSSGATFLARINEAFGAPHADGSPRLVNLATDGESYGHHFAFGDMALSWLFNHLEEEKSDITLTNYGEYLELFPPKKEVRLYENSSWSCVHGVERWRSNCGCNTGGGPDSNQKWRTPLRDGLNWLRDQLATSFTDTARIHLKDPWAARDDYVNVLLADYSQESKKSFLEKHQAQKLSASEQGTIFELLESQLMSLYMFTSCGWFFNDLVGLEPVQNLRYALRAIELGQQYSRVDLVEGLLNFLSLAEPNDKTYQNGLDVWQKLVATESLNNRLLAAHWAASTILDAPGVLSFFRMPQMETQVVTKLHGNGVIVLAGQVDIFDRRTGETASELCLALYSGSSHLAILVSEPLQTAGRESWLDKKNLTSALGDNLNASSALNIWEAMVKLTPLSSRFMMDNLLPSLQSICLTSMVDDFFSELKDYTREAFHMQQHLLMMHRNSGRPMDWMEQFVFRVMGEAEMERLLTPAAIGHPINLVALENLLGKRGLVGITKGEPLLARKLEKFLTASFERLEQALDPHQLLPEILALLQLVKKEHFDIDLWPSQNNWFRLLHDESFMSRLTHPDHLKLMQQLGTALGFKLKKSAKLVNAPHHQFNSTLTLP